MERKSTVDVKVTPSSNFYECSVCKQKFLLTAKYMKHMSIHRQLLLSCNICNKRFYNQKHLDEHYLSHADVISTYDCNTCPKKFLQKYQLEQHMQFHLTPVKQFVEKEKKRVQFNEILASKHISDDESETDNDSDEENNGSSTTTRYGRVVKAKKISKTPEVNSKYDKKEEICMKETNTAVLTSQLTIPEANNTIKQHSGAILNKEICVCVKKLPDDLCNDYIKKGCSITLDDSGDSFLKKYDDLQIGNEISKNVTKVCKEIQLKQINTDVEKSNENKNAKSVDDVTNGTPLNNINESFCKKLDNLKTIPNSSKVIDKKLIASNELPIKVDVRNTVPSNTMSACYEGKLNKKELIQNNVSQIAAVSSIPNLISENKTSPKSTVTKFKNAEQLPTAKTTKSHPIKPQVEKQFLYVGPPQNFDKVKTVIHEMKSPTDKSTKQIDDTSATNLLSALKRSVPGNEQTFVSTKCFKEESLNGIIDKKIVNNFLVVKVTPDFMKQIHKNLESKVKQSNISKTTVTNVSNSTITKSIRAKQSGNSVVGRNANMLAPMKTNSDNIKEICKSKENDTIKNSKKHVTGNISYLNAANKAEETCAETNKNCSNDKIFNGVKNIQTEKYVAQPNKMATSASSINCIMPSIESNISSLNSTNMNLKHCISETNKSCINDKNVNDTKMKTVQTSICTIPILDKKCIAKPRDYSLKYRRPKVLASTEVNHISGSLLAESSNESVSQMTNEFSGLNKSDQLNLYDASDTSKIKITQNLIDRYRAKIAEKEHKKKKKYMQKKKLRYLESQISKKYPTLSVSAVQLPKKKKSNLNSMPIVNTLGNKVSMAMENSNIQQSLVTGHFSKQIPQVKSSTAKDTATNCNLSPNLTSVTRNLQVSNTILQFDEKDAIKKVEKICQKFEEKLNENECLKYLKEIDTLITKFNIGKKCPFIFRTLRFCRLHVNNYNVKEYAGVLHTKVIEAM